MERKIKSVAVYVRKSREDETEEVLNRQQAILVELCQKNEWSFEIFKEVGSSQEIGPQLQKMLDKVKIYSYDAVVVNDLDRLSRTTVLFGIIKEDLIRAGCKVATPNKIYDFTRQEDDLYSDLQSVLAKNEYQTIKKRLVRGSIQSAKQGNWVGRKTPIGYKYNRKTKRLEITEDAPIIQRLFTDYASGMSTKDISYQYTLGVKTSVGMVWSSSGVSRLLSNPVYKGQSLYRKTKNEYGRRNIKTSKDEQILVEDTHEPIVSKELWNKVQEIKLSRNSRPIPLKLGKHTFSGLIKCALCNRVHSFQTSKGGKKRITSCQTRHYIDQSNNYTMCKNQGVNMDDFEILFYGHLEKYLHEIERYKDSIQDIKAKDKHEISSNIRTKEKELSRIDQDVKRVQDGFLARIFTEEQALERIGNLGKRKKNLIDELDRLKENEAMASTDYINNIINKMVGFLEGKDVLPPTESNNILREFIEVVYYKRMNNEIELDIVWKDY